MTIKNKDILPTESFNIWNSYLIEKEKGLKKLSSKLLNEFINSTKTLDYEILQNFVYNLTDKHLYEEIKIDFRLFERVIFPVLIKEIKLKKATANRRLAQFDQFLISPNPLFTTLKSLLDYDKDYFESAYFYQKEIELNNKDQIAISGILNKIATQLNYATHELPEYGLIVEIEYFKEELTRFKTILALFSKKEIWNNRIEHWEFVLKTWAAYLITENGTYQDYLKQNELIFIT